VADAMNRLACPFCGPRELQEFRFHKTLPSGTAASTVFGQVYERSASREHGSEHWQHTGGCRAWLLVERNPANGTVLRVELLGSPTA
jgi:sarcosine oxidase subunit delta